MTTHAPWCNRKKLFIRAFLFGLQERGDLRAFFLNAFQVQFDPNRFTDGLIKVRKRLVPFSRPNVDRRFAAGLFFGRRGSSFLTCLVVLSVSKDDLTDSQPRRSLGMREAPDSVDKQIYSRRCKFVCVGRKGRV